jgi:hypothetical protein
MENRLRYQIDHFAINPKPSKKAIATCAFYDMLGFPFAEIGRRRTVHFTSGRCGFCAKTREGEP